MDGFVPKLDLCATVSCLAPYCYNELFLMEGLRNSFEICKHMLTLYLASLLVSYTISLINKQNSRTFPWKLTLVIEIENAFWLPLSFLKKEI